MALAVCATPIGNLEDVTLRVLRELAEAEVVLAEDTRHTRGLLERHGIRARLLSYHEHNEAKRTAELLPRLEAGERMALVSDAGMPGISDPGARLVAAAIAAGVPVTFVTGHNALTVAAFRKGDVDIMWNTVDNWAREASVLAENNAKAKSVIMQDWSRGGDGIVRLLDPRTGAVDRERNAGGIAGMVRRRVRGLTSALSQGALRSVPVPARRPCFPTSWSGSTRRSSPITLSWSFPRISISSVWF